MAAPSYVPTSPTAKVRSYSGPGVVPDSWSADRSAAVDGPQPRGGMYGSQGPDQGYALKLAEALRPKLVLTEGESADDVLAGAVQIGLKRASLFTRGPVIHDLKIDHDNVYLGVTAGPHAGSVLITNSGRLNDLVISQKNVKSLDADDGSEQPDFAFNRYGGIRGPFDVIEYNGEVLVADGIGCHHLLPLGPFRVPDLDGDRSALGAAMSDARQEAHLIGLELLARTAAVAESTTGQGSRDVIGGDGHVGRHTLQHSSEYGAMGLPGGQPSEHVPHRVRRGYNCPVLPSQMLTRTSVSVRPIHAQSRPSGATYTTPSSPGMLM